MGAEVFRGLRLTCDRGGCRMTQTLHFTLEQWEAGKRCGMLDFSRKNEMSIDGWRRVIGCDYWICPACNEKRQQARRLAALTGHRGDPACADTQLRKRAAMAVLPKEKREEEAQGDSDD